MQEIKHLVMERLEYRKKELTDAKILCIQGDLTKREFWKGRKVALDGTTGEIPFLEKLLKIISEKVEE